MCVSLSACGIFNKPNPVPNIPPISLTDMQFECGPAAEPLPEPEVLATWSSRRLLEEYAIAWKWGSRCSGLHNQNKEYLEKALEARDPNKDSKK